MVTLFLLGKENERIFTCENGRKKLLQSELFINSFEIETAAKINLFVGFQESSWDD